MTSARSLTLTARDRGLLDALTKRVRVVSEAQAARTWWGSLRSTRRRVAVLESAGLVVRRWVMAHPELPLERPLLSWSPGEAEPEHRSTANLLRHRWPRPPVSTAIVVATEAAASWLGGHGGRSPRTSEVSHDLGLTALYLRFRGDSPARAQTWVSEARLAHAGWGSVGGMLPDALLRPEEGVPTVIEFCGRYPLAKLQRFHDYCFANALPYELW